MKWADLVPDTVAVNQASWDRRHAVHRAVMAGARQCDLAALMGLSSSRVHQLHRRAEFEIYKGRRCPVDNFLSRKGVWLKGIL